MSEKTLTCTFVSPLQGEGRGFETLSAHREPDDPEARLFVARQGASSVFL